MKCPLTVLVGQQNAVGNSRFWGDCIKSGCGWWRSTAESCAVKELPSALVTQNSLLGQIIARLDRALKEEV